MNNEKIIIEIAAYRDPELLNTVKSALIQADNPDRVFFAICYQSDDLTDYNELKKIKNCRIKYLKESEAKGSCYARYLTQQMIEDEKYLFQIDSHMRFVKHWDSKLIEELLSLNDPKACISFYPPSCTEEMMSLALDDETFSKPEKGGIMYTNGFRDGNSMFLSNQSRLTDDERLHKNPFTSAGNFFAFADIHREVLHDPEMYFYGDELPMAIRYYTHGWNNYCGGKSYVYHEYCRKNQTFPKYSSKMPKELEKFKRLLNLNNENYDLGEFGLGKERSIKDFEEFAGIDFTNKIVYMSAETGNFEDEKLRKQISYLERKKIEERKKTTKEEQIEVLIVDRFGDYQECINTALNNAFKKERIKFIVGTTKQEELKDDEIKKLQVKKIINFKNDFSYSKVLSELSKNIGNCYITIIDSSVRLLKNWEQELYKTIIECGNNSALTNWVWYNQENKPMAPYTNIIKEIAGFNNYLPVLKYNETINLAERKHPYQTPIISDGFLFCHSSTLNEVEIDPNLNFEEHKYVYSARLWTSGIDLFYPKVSHAYKIREEKYFDDEHCNNEIICGLLGLDNNYGKQLNSDYKYELGTKRPLWGWYDFIKFDPENIK